MTDAGGWPLRAVPAVWPPADGDACGRRFSGGAVRAWSSIQAVRAPAPEPITRALVALRLLAVRPRDRYPRAETLKVALRGSLEPGS